MKKRIALMTLTMMLFCSLAYAGDGQFPTTYNVTLVAANTEYAQSLTGVKRLTIQCRTAYDVRWAYVGGKVAGSTSPYMTIKSGTVFQEDALAIRKTLFFASSKAGVVVEILVYR